MSEDRRVTSVSWPVVVDERLRLLARLAAHESGQPGRVPSASRVLQNLILRQRLTGVAHLGEPPSEELLEAADEANTSYSWLDREPFYGRPRKRSYDVPQAVVQKRGVRLPKNAVSVARPSRYGNPWKVSHSQGVWQVEGEKYRNTFESQIGAHTAAVDLYSRWIGGDQALRSDSLDQRRERITASLTELQGKDLACYCPKDLPCHRDVLLVRANAVPGEDRTPTMNAAANAGVRMVEQWIAQAQSEAGEVWATYPVPVRRGLVAKLALDELADTEGAVNTATIRSVMTGISEVLG